jgi:hypothetical protein
LLGVAILFWEVRMDENEDNVILTLSLVDHKASGICSRCHMSTFRAATVIHTYFSR